MHSSIFSGRVSHARKSPTGHAFHYKLFMMYLDLDELDHVFGNRWFWSTKRSALARYKRSNYFGDRNEPLDVSIRRLVGQHTDVRPLGPIRLLTNLSYYGYCFNPISIYYCFDQSDTRVETIVAEVRNTPWGECHCYVLPENENTGDDVTRRFQTGKQLHVSPFMGMNMSYDWLLTTPDEKLVVRIDNQVEGKALFGATLQLKRIAISGPALAGVLLRYPFMTFKVMFGIHWQAFRLWCKNCPIVPHPKKKSAVEVVR